MKYLATTAAFVVMWGCGILSLIFDSPDRYIDREVRPQEMTGTWKIIPTGETEVDAWVMEEPDWGIYLPWKAMSLNEDGSCSVAIEPGWLRAAHADKAAGDLLSCAWKLSEIDNLDGEPVPGLELDLKYPGNYDMLYSLYLYEENGELVLWNFIGDPDDFQTQDFVKSGQ
jgi:hypothetical protein